MKHPTFANYLLKFLGIFFVTICLSSQIVQAQDSNKNEANKKNVRDRILSRTVGEISESKLFISSRDVQIHTALDQMLLQMDSTNKEKDIQLIQLDDSDLPNRVNQLLLEWVIYKEAMSFSAESISKPEIQKELKYVEEKIKPIKDWASLDVDSTELKNHLSRMLLVRKFMQLKTESSKIPVTDEECELYFKKNRARFGSMPFENFKENIRTFLQNTQTEQRLKAWYEVLNRKYKVRNFLAG